MKPTRKSPSGQIRQLVNAVPEGDPFTSKSFLSVGTRTSVDQALSRLARGGEITRLTRGVYVKAKENRFIGKILPTPIKVAEAIARSTGATIEVHGAEAARQFQLSTQVPTQTVFYTSGPTRKFRLGKLKVTLRHTSPRKLALAGRPAGLALIALWDLGEELATSKVIESIRSKLPRGEFEVLRAATHAMPGWMADAFLRHEREHANG